MNYLHIVEASAAAIILASFTDWYFFGILFHDRYHAIPGAWKKYTDKKDEMTSITVSMLYQSITSIIFIGACGYLQLNALLPALVAALVVWLMVPLPLLLSYSVFLKTDKLIIVSHSLGWLARLLVSAVCAALLL
jgi:hypothetical protein